MEFSTTQRGNGMYVPICLFYVATFITMSLHIFELDPGDSKENIGSPLAFSV